MDSIKQWFLEQSPRDQIVLSMGGIAVVLFILFFVVLFPMQEAQSKQERRNLGLLAEQQEVLALAGRVKASKQPGGATGEGGQSLNSIVNATTRQFNVRMDSLQPSGNMARVRLGSSEFDNVIAWLNELEVKRGLQIRDLTISADTVPGKVNTQLQIVKGE